MVLRVSLVLHISSSCPLFSRSRNNGDDSWKANQEDCADVISRPLHPAFAGSLREGVPKARFGSLSSSHKMFITKK